MLISNMIFLVVSLRRVAPNTSEQRSRSGLCKRVIRREATETEGLVYCISYFPEYQELGCYDGNLAEYHFFATEVSVQTYISRLI